MSVSITRTETVTRADADRLLVLATHHDGVEPFGEAFIRGLDDAAFQHHHYVAVTPENEMVALLAVASDSAEIVVAPDWRRRGIAKRLLAEIDADSAQKPRPLWAHGNIPGAKELAEVSGRRPVRELLQMTVPAEALKRVAGGVEKRDDVKVLTYAEAIALWGEAAADRAWLEANNEAFDWHPEQGHWTLADLKRAQDTDWFDPAGVFFAILTGANTPAMEPENLLGFHWTKTHAGADIPTAEVYVIGLKRAARGRGLGGWLTDVGLAAMRNNGAEQVILYVEGNNVPAVATYRKSGFQVTRKDVMYGVL